MFDTTNVKTYNTMFAGCSSLTYLDLSSFDTSTSGLVFQKMFIQCTSLCSIVVGDKFTFGKAVTSKLTEGMFTGCTNLVGGRGTKFDPEYTDFTYACIDQPDRQGYFTSPVSLY